MKKSELRQLIREELQGIMSEAPSRSPRFGNMGEPKQSRDYEYGDFTLDVRKARSALVIAVDKAWDNAIDVKNIQYQLKDFKRYIVAVEQQLGKKRTRTR